RGRWLIAGRCLWLATAALVVVVLIPLIHVQYWDVRTYMMARKDYSLQPVVSRIHDPAVAALYTHSPDIAGITADVLAIPFFAVAVILFWRKSDELSGLLASLFL